MNVSLVSYATGKFVSVQRELVESAKKWGISTAFSYSRADLTGSDYYRSNQSILDEPCGAGFWAWKPFFILEALGKLADGDVLFYCDAGSLFIDDPAPLVQLCLNHPQGLVLFDSRPLTNRQFTKRDCFVRLGCDAPEYWNATKVIATLLVIRKCDTARRFLQEWLHHCRDRRAITNDRNQSGLPELSGFIQHRWDQSILSLLTAKHRLETYRNPTRWGNFLKLPPYRVAGEQVESPYGLPLGINDYSPTPQANSPYGTLFVINRLPNYEHKKPFLRTPFKDRAKSGIKFVLKKLGLRRRA